MGGRDANSSELLSLISYPLSPFFSYSCALFCAFLHCAKSQLFSFQALAHSLTKKHGVGAPPLPGMSMALAFISWNLVQFAGSLGAHGLAKISKRSTGHYWCLKT